MKPTKRTAARGPTLTPILGALLALRLRARMSQAELARALGCWQSEVSRRELGRPMSRAAARKYADYFDAKLSEFIAQD